MNRLGGWLWLAVACGAPAAKTTDTLTTPPTTSTTPPTVTTPTSTTTECPVQLETESECNTCVTDACCSEMTAFGAAPDDDASLQAFSDCSLEHCSETCVWGFCGGVFGSPDLSVATCMIDTCCAITESCAANPKCVDCLLEGDPSSCNGSTIDEQVISCLFACGYGS